MPELGNCCLGKEGVAAKEVTGACATPAPAKAAPPMPWAMLPGRLTTGAGGGVTAPLLKLLLEMLLFTGDI